MGYYTWFDLDVDDCGKEAVNGHKQEIEKLSGYSGLFEEEVKWYAHERNLREHSSKYPGLLFRLSGHGEESGDIWVEFYKNGKMFRSDARIVFDAYDENKLA